VCVIECLYKPPHVGGQLLLSLRWGAIWHCVHANTGCNNCGKRKNPMKRVPDYTHDPGRSTFQWTRPFATSPTLHCRARAPSLLKQAHLHRLSLQP
jgi:hypothetical protein